MQQVMQDSTILKSVQDLCLQKRNMRMMTQQVIGEDFESQIDLLQ